MDREMMIKITAVVTRNLSRTQRDKEKEHSASCQSAPTDDFIIAVPDG